MNSVAVAVVGGFVESCTKDTQQLLADFRVAVKVECADELRGFKAHVVAVPTNVRMNKQFRAGVELETKSRIVTRNKKVPVSLSSPQ